MNLFIKILLFLIVVLLVLFLIERTTSLDLGLLNEQVSPGHEERDNDGGDQDKVRIIDGYKAVELDGDVVEAAGIKYEKLTAVTFKPEFPAYAEAIDIAPLVLLKTKYNNLLAEKNILQNNLHSLNQIYKRAEALHKNKSLSTRELEQNRADRDLKSSELSALTTRMENLAYEIKSNWGNEISGLVLTSDKQETFTQLATHQASLILISLLKDQSLSSEQQTVFVSSNNQHDSALVATYLDRANQISNPLYGESYIYVVESKKFRPGVRLFAWIEEEGENLSGLVIPDSAIIWYASEPWIYIKLEDDLFVRKPVGKARKLSDGWLIDETLFHNVQVVTQGGQTLLSEEFKWAIPDEEDD